jgi:dCMP deaminase
MEKRKDYISWDEYFMGVAVLSSLRSKDPSTQVGACVASDRNKVLTMGYNGMPIGCNDEVMPWGRDGDDVLNQKYMYVCHAEFNAILNARVSLDGSRIYVTLFPCNECAKAIIQSGIKEVIYIDDKYKDLPMTIASKKMFDLAGVKYRKFEGTMPTIEFKRK